jgi:LacI family fructose operon transcriptional repressor
MARSSSGRKSTIYDIAKATGSSTSAVSMVLNGTWARYRIKEETAKRILDSAEQLGYNVNMKARGLRLSRSGLAGMILPHYRNRFFAGLAENFEEQARSRGLCPIVVSTQRDPAVEMSVTETLISQQVELLFIAGVRNPTPLDDLCSAAGIPCINVDLPGPGAPSVVSDNRGGARALTDALMEKMIARGNAPGVDAVECFGYGAVSSRRALARRYESLGRLPAGLLMNSITAFEGLVQFASRLPREAWHSTVVGCFDWDPFAVHLPFEVTMMRQDVQKIILEAFALADSHDTTARPVVVVPTGFGQMLDEDELPIKTEYES